MVNRLISGCDVVVIDFQAKRVEVVRKRKGRAWAKRFCQGFNKDERARPSGLWAIVVPSTITNTISDASFSRSLA